MRHLLLCVGLLSAACSQTPTAPTLVREEPIPLAGKLHWEVMASSGCPATATPNPKPDLSTASLHQERDGSITASWQVEKAGRPAILYANFIEHNGVWAMCSWDTADV